MANCETEQRNSYSERKTKNLLQITMLFRKASNLGYNKGRFVHGSQNSEILGSP